MRAVAALSFGGFLYSAAVGKDSNKENNLESLGGNNMRNRRDNLMQVAVGGRRTVQAENNLERGCRNSRFFKTQHTPAKEFTFWSASTGSSTLRRELVAMKEKLLEMPSTWCTLRKLKPSAGHDITRKHSKWILPWIPKEAAPQYVQQGKMPAAEKILV